MRCQAMHCTHYINIAGWVKVFDSGWSRFGFSFSTSHLFQYLSDDLFRCRCMANAKFICIDFRRIVNALMYIRYRGWECILNVSVCCCSNMLFALFLFSSRSHLHETLKAYSKVIDRAWHEASENTIAQCNKMTLANKCLNAFIFLLFISI